MSIKLDLTDNEAEWLAAVLGLVMEIGRKWDNRTADDVGNRLLAKLSLARIDEMQAQRDDALMGVKPEPLGNDKN